MHKTSASYYGALCTANVNLKDSVCVCVCACACACVSVCVCLQALVKIGAADSVC